ncbi:unnamed protein product [Arabidopsis lyrata]|nr:unnamed protein product [Arabidopsis lyrata]
MKPRDGGGKATNKDETSRRRRGHHHSERETLGKEDLVHNSKVKRTRRSRRRWKPPVDLFSHVLDVASVDGGGGAKPKQIDGGGEREQTWFKEIKTMWMRHVWKLACVVSYVGLRS